MTLLLRLSTGKHEERRKDSTQPSAGRPCHALLKVFGSLRKRSQKGLQNPEVMDDLRGQSSRTSGRTHVNCLQQL